MSKAVSDKIEIFPAELSYAGAIAGIDRECFSEPDSECLSAHTAAKRCPIAALWSFLMKLR